MVLQILEWVLVRFRLMRLGERHVIALTSRFRAVVAIDLIVCVRLKLAIPIWLLLETSIPLGPMLWRMNFVLRVVARVLRIGLSIARVRLGASGLRLPRMLCKA